MQKRKSYINRKQASYSNSGGHIKVSIFTLLLITVTFANVPFIPLNQVKLQKRNHWVKTTGTVKDLLFPHIIVLEDNNVIQKVQFSNVQKSKIKQLMAQISLGDEITIVGPIKGRLDLKKPIIYMIYRDGKLLYQQFDDYKLSLPLSYEQNPINETIYNFKKRRRRKAITYISVSKTLQAAVIGLKLKDARHSNSDGDGGAFEWTADFLYNAFIISIVSIGTPFTINGISRAREARNTPDPTISKQTLLLSLDLKPTSQGAGLFITGRF